jgi:hypothetical protein
MRIKEKLTLYNLKGTCRCCLSCCGVCRVLHPYTNGETIIDLLEEVGNTEMWKLRMWLAMEMRVC